MVPGAEASGLVAPRMARARDNLASGRTSVTRKLTAAGLDGVLALPDHSANGAAQHVWNWVSVLSDGSKADD